MSREAELREAICEVGSRFWQHGLIVATEGNISARLDSERVICTPSGTSKGHMCPQDLVVVNLESGDWGGASSEFRMHAALYRCGAGAVVHAHPRYATAFALAQVPIPDGLLPEAVAVLGTIQLVPFAMPGTDAIGEALMPLADKHCAFLLSNHGAVCTGSDIWEANNRIATLERVAELYFRAAQLGGAKPLPHRVVRALRGLVGDE